ncbi:MAG: SpoIIE family protein phosphatase [Armatimonadota bacterium]
MRHGPDRPPVWVGYVVTLLLEVLLTTGLLLLQPYFPLGSFPITYVLVIMLVAHLFGEGPAVLAFFSGLYAYFYYFVPPIHEFMLPTSHAGWAGLIAFLMGTSIVGYATIAMRRSRRRIRQLLAEAQREVAERKAAEAALQESQEDLNRAQEVAHTGSWRLDVRRNELLWSDESYRIFGVPQGTPQTYDTFLATVHPEDLEYVDREWTSALRGEYYDIVHRIVVDGNVKWVREKATLEFDKDGSLLGGFGTTQDVTDLHEAQEALRKQVITLQRALLPSNPSIGPGYRLGSVYIPAFAGEEVGGDFYDIFETEDGRVGILIGDVAGKGIEAASIGATARSTIRAFAYDTSSPGSALIHANKLLARQYTSGNFVTVFLAILDQPTGELRCCAAGHPPAMIHRASGDVEFLCKGNLPIGVLERYEFAESEDRLGPGDRIVLYTDGLTEARHGVEMFETSGIERVLRENMGEPPQETVDALLAAARDWAHGQLSDDIAIIEVERSS